MSESTAPAEQTSPVGDKTDHSSEKPENVPYNKFRELLDEKKREQAEKRALAERIAEYEKRERDKEEELAKKRGDYEKLIQTRDQEINELRSRVSASEKRDQDVKKLGAFLRTVGSDIDEKWLGLVDLKSIAIDPTSGDIDQMSVAQTVDNFKKIWPEALKKPGATIPTEAPNGSGLKAFIKQSEYAKLPLKEMRKYKPSQIIKD